VRNTLALVRSIARRTADSSDSVGDYAKNLDGRIEAFSRVQAALTRDPRAGVDLKTLVTAELRAHGAQDRKQVSIDGPQILLKPKAAELFALAIHELATNAVKYGALSAASGRIDVAWAIDGADGQPQLAFRWSESGVRPASVPSRRSGFGTELIERTLAYDLNGKATLRLDPHGLQCAIAIPVTDRLLLDDQAEGASAP
jgi:two-component system, chemotaxis family, CheB/CheR fusion protein